MKKFKLYVEVPSAIGSITYVSIDRFPLLRDGIDMNNLALHMYNNRLSVAMGNEFKPMIVHLDKEKFNSIKKEISRGNRNSIDRVIFISDMTLPLISFIEKPSN